MTDTGILPELVERLLFGLADAELYGTGNPRVREGAEQAAFCLAVHCRTTAVPSVRVETVGGLVVLQGRPALGASLSARRLIYRIQAWGAGGVEFLATVTAHDILALLKVLATRAVGCDHEGANAELRLLGTRGVRFLAPKLGTVVGGRRDGWSPSTPTDGDPTSTACHPATMDLLQKLAQDAFRGMSIDLGAICSAVEEAIAGSPGEAGTHHAPSLASDHDWLTLGHSVRVALLSVEVGRTLQHDEHALRRLGSAALLHDIGMLLVPREIVRKRAPLNSSERREMQRHTALGASILLQDRSCDGLAVAAAYGHHDAFGGAGYAWTHGEFEAGTVTKLIKLCDVFAALTAARPYRPAMSPLRAHRTMFEMRGHFDPVLHGHFVRTIGLYPAGTLLRLNDRSLAHVVRQTRDLQRPVVRVLERNGERLDVESQREIDLTAPGPGDPTAVEVSMAPPSAVARTP